MEKVLKQLQRLGFGEYEARAYVALIPRQPLNGYELAKASGVPRANIYAVLQKLEARDAVVRLETSSGARYAPVPPPELMQRLSARFEEALQATQRSLAKIAGPTEHEYVWNVRGYSVLLEEARAIVEATQTSLLVALWHQEAQALAEHLARAEARGVEVTTLCLEACPQQCNGCRGRVYRYRVALDQQTRWLVLVANAAEVLAAEIEADKETLAIRTRHKLLVDLAAWYIRHNIAVAAILSDLGGRLKRSLTPKTRSVLEAIGPDQQQTGWLEHMRKLLNRPQPEME